MEQLPSPRSEGPGIREAGGAGDEGRLRYQETRVVLYRLMGVVADRR
jgi:hypothetical protein